MIRNILAVSLIITLYVTSCSTKVEQAQSNTDPKAQEIVDKAIAEHGGAAYESVAVGFDFREKHYTVERYPDRYVYTRSW
ncbi:MAG: DUF6503 family protein, partial [Imperialibacter sp.]